MSSAEHLTPNEPSSAAGRSRRRVPPRRLLGVGLPLLVGCLIGWLLFGDHGSSKPSAVKPGVVTASVQPATYAQVGVDLKKARTWKSTVQTGAIKLLSPDQTASIAITAPALAGHEAAFRRTDKKELLKLFAPGRVLARTRGRIGGQKALITEIVGRYKSRHPLQILSTALSSPYRTYSIQVFTTFKPAPIRLAEIRATLDSIRFSKPKG
ncbi:MAG: hypothetical protein NVSMB51_00900 [Solirubrobacteraceae bacterium]